MGKKNDPFAPEGQPTEQTPEEKAQADKLAALMGKAKAVETFTEQWTGYTPEQLGATPDTVEQLDEEALLNAPVVVFGYSKRDGQYGAFMIVLCVPVDTKTVSTFSTGGVVLLRKFALVGERNGFPIRGKLIRPEGKRYYDFVSE